MNETNLSVGGSAIEPGTRVGFAGLQQGGGIFAGAEAEKKRAEAHAKYETQQARDRDTSLRIQAIKQALKLASLTMEPTSAMVLDDAEAIYNFITNKETDTNE